MVGVSPFKGRRMDEILDAEYKVVEHPIARPLDPSPRWRFQRLARGRSVLDDASYAELVKPSTDVPPTAFRSVEPKLFERILDQTLAGPGNACIGGAWCPPCVKREVDMLGAGSSSPPRPYYRLGLPHGQVPDTAHRFFARFEVLFGVRDSTDNQIAHANSPASFGSPGERHLWAVGH